MSKKTRRQRRVNLPPEAFNNPTAMPQPRPQTATSAPASPTTNGRVTAAAPINWREEYGDVLGDLKRTGILAVIMMAVMVALSFIIR
jgi:hypothetical protein